MSLITVRRFANDRGMTLVEVLVAIVLLVLVFIFVAENMIASSWAESKASQRTTNVSAANYLLAIMHGDPSLWASYPDTPKDACGQPMTPVDDAGPSNGGTWHSPPACSYEPPTLANVQYQWRQSAPVADASNVTIWVRNTVASSLGNKTDEYELHAFTHQVPTVPTLQPPPSSPPPTFHSIPPSSPPPSTPPPSPTATPTATPTHTPTPIPTPTPIGV